MVVAARLSAVAVADAAHGVEVHRGGRHQPATVDGARRVDLHRVAGGIGGAGEDDVAAAVLVVSVRLLAPPAAGGTADGEVGCGVGEGDGAIRRWWRW
jgi:hypothetical protein